MKRTFVYDAASGKLVETTGSAVRNAQLSLLQNDRHYSDQPFKAHDGTVINSRRKHREYMRRHGLTTMDDYGRAWKDAEKRRAEYFGGGNPDKAARLDAVRRAVEAHTRGK